MAFAVTVAERSTAKSGVEIITYQEKHDKHDMYVDREFGEDSSC